MSKRQKTFAKVMSHVSALAIISVLGAAAATAQSVSNTSPNYTGYDVSTITGFYNNSLISSSNPALSVSGNIDGNFVNDGDMLSSSHGVVVEGLMNGDFTNSADAEIIAHNVAVYFNSEGMTGNFVNSGLIETGQGYGVHSSVYFLGQLTGDFTNTSSGVIRADDFAIIFEAGVEGDFLNEGEMYAGNRTGVLICHGLSGDFINAAGATIWAEEMGVVILNTYNPVMGPNQASEVALNGNFSNFGKIYSGNSHGVYISNGMIGDFVNAAGAELVANNSGVKIENSNQDANNCIGLEGNFYNDGRITSGDSHGVTIDGGMIGDFTNGANGRIEGNDLGVAIVRNGQDAPDGLEGDFVNYGYIFSGECHGVYIDGGMTGEFVNASRSEIQSIGIGVLIRGDDGEDLDSLVGNFTNAGLIESGDSDGVGFGEGRLFGDFTNSSGGIIRGSEIAVHICEGIEGNFVNAGEIYSSDSHGVQVREVFTGSFKNTSSGSLIGNNIGAMFRSFSGVTVFDGNFENDGVLRGSSHGVVFDGTFDGDFVNSASGRIGSIDGWGVLLTRDYIDDGGLDNHEWIGSFTNAGLIEGGSGFPSEAITYDSDLRAGFEVQGDFTGEFLNTGTIRAAQAVLVQGNFTGSYANKGELTGAYDGFDTRVITFNPSEKEQVLYRGYSTVIGGNFDGDLTNVVGEGVFVGTVTWDGSDEGSAAMKTGTGDADFQGHEVGVHVNQIVEDGFSWTAVDAENLLLDAGFEVQDNSYMFDFDHNVVDDNLILTARQTSTVSEAIGGLSNELGIAGLFDDYQPGDNEVLDAVLGEIHSQSTSEDIAGMLVEMSPSVQALRNATFNTGTLFDEVGMRHLRGGSESSAAVGGGDQNASAVSVNGGAAQISPAGYTSDYMGLASVWLEGIGGSATADGSGAFGGVDASTLGAVIGVDADIHSAFRVTGSFGYYASEADMTDGNSGDSSDASGWLMSAGARYEQSSVYVLANVSLGWHSVDETREDDFHSEVYTASYDGSHVNLSGEIGYEITASGFAFTPFLAGTLHNASFDSYTEEGGPLALTVDEQSYSFGFVDAGARASTMMFGVELAGLLGYRSGFGDGLDGEVTASLAGSDFETATDLEIDGVIAGASMRVDDLAGFGLGAAYRGIFGESVSSHNVSLEMSKGF